MGEEGPTRPHSSQFTLSPRANAISALVLTGLIGVAWAAGSSPSSAPVGSALMPGDPVPTGAQGVDVLPAGTPLNALTCSQLESPSALSEDLASLYSGYTLGSYVTGPNGTPALGISSYPNLTVGQTALISDWATICQSPQFGYAYVQANGSQGFTPGSELAGDGHYEYDYGFTWQNPCYSMIASAGGSCEAIATWSVDLVTDAIVGPTCTNQEYAPFGAPLAT
jgi:hypothetical protein